MSADETKRQRQLARLGELKQSRQSYDSHFKELAEFILPRRARFLITDNNRGAKAFGKIIDSTATLSARTCSSGMMAGLTSPARPWFRLSTPDPAQNEIASVKGYLYQVESRMREVFLRSNLYNVLPMAYTDMAVFGTAALACLEDERKVVRFDHYQIGMYYIANAWNGIVDTIYRTYTMTVRQLVQQFATPNRNRPTEIDWSKLSTTVKTAWESKQRETPIEIVHLIEPNVEAGGEYADNRHMPFVSCWFELQGPQDRTLQESGFNEFPVMAPRWSLVGEDVWGESPGMQALGDIKALQLMQKRAAQGLDKVVNPPMVAPQSMMRSQKSLLPGDTTYIPNGTAQGVGYQPAYVPNIRLGELRQHIIDHQSRIQRVFYEDLFLMLTNDERQQPVTAREIDERHEEKLLMLGPVLERLGGELLDPIIGRTLAIMQRRGMLPPLPQELQGQQVKVEYISILAQAQRSVGTGSLERLGGFVTQLATVIPDVLDKFDADQAVDEYGGMLGVPPSVVRTDDAVAEIRAQRQQQIQRQQAMAAAAPAAKAAKDLAAAPMGGDTALTQLLKGVQGGGQGTTTPTGLAAA